MVVIILIAAGIAVPSFSGTSKSARMKDALRSTIRISRYARNMAILEQTDCTLTFATNRITLTNPEKTLAFRSISEQVHFSNFKNLATNEDNKDDGQTVLFYPSGMNDGFEITLSDSDRTHTVSCNPITGKMTIQED